MNEENYSAETIMTEKKRPFSRMAIASLFVGLAVFVCLPVWLNAYECNFYWPILGGIVFACIAALRLEKIHRRGIGFIIAGMIFCALAFFLQYPLVRAKALADTIKCAENLIDIAKAIEVYQANHDGHNPHTLETLVELGILKPEKLICPCHKEQNTCSYIYRGNDLNVDVPGSMILAYDRLDNHDSDGEPGDDVNVLSADGHVKYYSESSMWDIIDEDNEQRQRLGLPEKPIEMTPRFDREKKLF